MPSKRKRHIARKTKIYVCFRDNVNPTTVVPQSAGLTERHCNAVLIDLEAGDSQTETHRIQSNTDASIPVAFNSSLHQNNTQNLLPRSSAAPGDRTETKNYAEVHNLGVLNTSKRGKNAMHALWNCRANFATVHTYSLFLSHFRFPTKKNTPHL